MNICKFSKDNIEYYANFAVWIQDIDLNRLKFLDESHFELRRMFFIEFLIYF